MKSNRLSRLCWTLAGITLAMICSGCDATDQAVEAGLADSLRPYFLNTKILPVPQREVLIGFTCIDGAGPALVEQVRQTIATNPRMGELRQFRQLGIGSYRYLAVGFDHNIIRYDIDSGILDEIAPWPGYEVGYRQTCGLGGGGIVDSTSTLQTQQEQPVAMPAFVPYKSPWKRIFNQKLLLSAGQMSRAGSVLPGTAKIEINAKYPVDVAVMPPSVVFDHNAFSNDHLLCRHENVKKLSQVCDISGSDETILIIQDAGGVERAGSLNEVKVSLFYENE